MTRCDGVKMHNLLFVFILKICSEIVQLSCAVIFCGCTGTDDEEGFWPATF